MEKRDNTHYNALASVQVNGKWNAFTEYSSFLVFCALKYMMTH